MEPVAVGIREFRARLAEFLLDGNRPVAVTRHGTTIGYFIPARAGEADLDRAALKAAAAQMDAMLRRAHFGERELEKVVGEFGRRRRKS
jgi:hypothetical protein